MKKLVNGCFGNIYYATVNKEKGIMGNDRKELTDNAIECVFQWFIYRMEFGDKINEGPLEEYSVTFKNSGYTLKMVRSDTEWHSH